MSEFKTMLAGKAPPAEQMEFPVLASPKLDGVRCHIIDGVAVSRNLLPFRNPAIQAAFGRQELNGLDGELMVGSPTHPEAFRKTGVLNSYDGDVSSVRLFVFDDFTHPRSPFGVRLDAAGRRCVKKDDLVKVKHKTIYTADELTEYETKMVEAGYEGIMTRHPGGPYKYGRSTAREGWLLKVKRFEDSEAVIDDALELQHNQNEKTLIQSRKAKRNSQKAGMVPGGVLGKICVRDIHTGVDFRIGTGFDAAERIELWHRHARGELVGQVVKYRFFPTGGKEKPRFPSFVGFRDVGDM